MKLIWISDLHFVAEGMVQGHDPRVRVAAAVDHINAHHADAVGCVISGDMVDRGESADYQALAAILARLQVPVLPMVGNHDNRTLLRRAFPLPDGAMQDFVQFSVVMGPVQVICLDTQKTGQDSGEFCAKRLAWLEDILRRSYGRPTLLFLHHPPLPLGLPMQDRDCMEDGTRLLDMVARFDAVQHLMIGHVHRPISGRLRGIPFTTLRSALYQAPAPEPAWDWDSFAPAREAPDLGVIHIDTKGLTIHYQQFCPYEAGGA